MHNGEGSTGLYNFLPNETGRHLFPFTGEQAFLRSVI
jgi:hypothetical protein